MRERKRQCLSDQHSGNTGQRHYPCSEEKLHRRVASEQQLEKGKSLQAKGGRPERRTSGKQNTEGGQNREGAGGELGEVAWNHTMVGEGHGLPHG